MCIKKKDGTTFIELNVCWKSKRETLNTYEPLQKTTNSDQVPEIVQVQTNASDLHD